MICLCCHFCPVRAYRRFLTLNLDAPPTWSGTPHLGFFIHLQGEPRGEPSINTRDILVILLWGHIFHKKTTCWLATDSDPMWLFIFMNRGRWMCNDSYKALKAFVCISKCNMTKCWHEIHTKHIHDNEWIHYTNFLTQHMQFLILLILYKSTHSLTYDTQKTPHLIVLSLHRQREAEEERETQAYC